MKRAMTLIEMILVIVIGSILSLATFKAMEAIYLHSQRSKAITMLSLESQIVLNQLEAILYERVPGTAIGYTPSQGCEAVDSLTKTHPILEWIGSSNQELIEQKYDSFANLMSKRPYLQSYNIDSSIDSKNMTLIFAGSLESGIERLKACQGAYGWHGNDDNLTFDFTLPEDNIIEFGSGNIPDIIYEKYYLAKSAYAVARAKDINKSAPCISRDLSGIEVDDNTLLLFYNYKPWRSETFCADPQGDNKKGNVTVLAKDVSGFRVIYSNDILRVGIDMKKSIKGSNPVHIVKQKAIF